MDYWKMGEFFHMMRLACDITPEELAERTNIPLRFIIGFEEGKGKPTIEYFVRLCMHYQLSFNIAHEFYNEPTNASSISILSQHNDFVL